MVSGYYGSFAWSDADKAIYIGRDLVLSEESALFINPTSVVFGDNVTTINPNLFNGSSKLASITIGSGVTEIGQGAFKDAGSHGSVESVAVSMGNNVVTIGNNAFRNISKMTAVTLSASLTTIGDDAFASTGLSELTIPAKVTTIGQEAFAWNSSLASITIADSNEPLNLYNNYYRTFRNLSSAYSLYLGRDITCVGHSNAPFSVAQEIEFGLNVTTIGKQLSNVTATTVKAPWQSPIAIDDAAFNASTYKDARCGFPAERSPHTLRLTAGRTSKISNLPRLSWQLKPLRAAASPWAN